MNDKVNKRKIKVANKRKHIIACERRERIIRKEKQDKANRKITEAIEVVVGRAMAKLDMSDIDARYLVAGILMEHFLVDEPLIPHSPAPALTNVHSDNNVPEVLEKKVGFDRAAWTPKT